MVWNIKQLRTIAVEHSLKFQLNCPLFHNATRLYASQPKTIKKNGSVEWLKRFSPPNRAVLDLDEVLYLAQEAGIATRQEIQKQIMTSPSFSPDRSPFLIENIFLNAEQSKTRFPSPPPGSAISARAKVNASDTSTNDEKCMTQIGIETNDNEKSINECDATNNEMREDRILTETVQLILGDSPTEAFWFDGQQYSWESKGKGTNRTATAHVVLRRGTGRIFFISGRDYVSRFRHFYHRFDILRPFDLTNTCGVFDVYSIVRGSGQTAQSLALKLAIARALSSANRNTTEILQKELMLYEDTRPRWPSMPMRVRSRAGYKFRKR